MTVRKLQFSVAYYLPGQPEPLTHNYVNVLPPIPRRGETVVIDDSNIFVVSSVTHNIYTASSGGHGVSVLLQDPDETNILFDDADLAETPAKSTSKVPRDDTGACLYCYDVECPGGEDCNFYDGSYD